MKLQILSDLHLEFHVDGGNKFLESIPVMGDVLVLAGDIGNYLYILDHLKFLAAKWKDVIYVPGNHEYYGSSFSFVDNMFSQFSVNCPPNLHILMDSCIEIEGQRFIGGTLWFPIKTRSLTHSYMLSDFSLISDITHTVFRKNEATKKYLAKNVTPQDIVVTHHLPISLCVDKQYKGSAMNKYFVGEADDVVENNKPRMWIYGHTHIPNNFRRRKTRMVCNPIGYPNEISFDAECTVSV